MKLFHFRILLLVFSLFSLQGCATTYSATSIEAHVVDAKTNQPLEGVVVIAHWELEYGCVVVLECFISRGPRQLQIFETITDAQGRFYFPAWGPLSAPFHMYLRESDPWIFIFKPGYKASGEVNDYPSTFDFRASSTRSSQINGMTIKLKKFEGDLKEYAQDLSLSGDLEFATRPPSANCDWQKIPHMLAAVFKQGHVFRENNIYSSLPTIERLPYQNQCGSATEFMKEYMK